MSARESERNDITVSVIVPAYNAGQYIIACLESLVHQTLKDMEIIVIDDGSTDNTGNIISEYQRQHSLIIAISQSNSGVSASRNAGLSVAHGKYIGFVDADDTVDFDMFAQLYAKAEEENADLVQCWHYKIDGTERLLRKPGRDCVGESIYANPKIISKQTFYVWDKLFRRSIIQEYGIKFPSLAYHEDICFLIEYELHAKNIIEVPQILYNYNWKNVGSACNSFDRRLLDTAKAFSVINEMVLATGYFSEFESNLFQMESASYLRRLNDFFLYNDKELQEDVAKALFALFDTYFYNWKKKIRSKDKTSMDQSAHLYRTDWEEMLKYIHLPLLYRRLRRKLYVLRKKCQNKKKVLSEHKYLERWKKTQYLAAYARYLKKPIKEDTVLLFSDAGRSLGDSMYYMAADLMQRTGYKIFVAIRSNQALQAQEAFLCFNQLHTIQLVNMKSRSYLELLATSKYLVANAGFPSYFFKRKEQVYVETWHGTPLKTLGRALNRSLSDLGNSQGNFLAADYLLYPNEYTRDVIMESFFLDHLYTGTVVLNGYPRNSAFFHEEDALDLRQKLRLQDKKVYIYMPTWRGDGTYKIDANRYLSELENILAELDRQLDDDIVVYIKLHRFMLSRIGKRLSVKGYRHLRLPKPCYENYRFVNMADGLITDYSSIFFDFANTRKEIILFPYDLDEYQQQRGMYFDLKTLPFQQFYTVDSLASHLNEKKFFVPDEKYLEFCNTFCRYDSAIAPQQMNDIMLYGSATEDLKIKSYAENGEKSYNLYFMSNLSTEIQKEQFRKLVDTAEDDVLFVFAHWSFRGFTEDMLREESCAKIKYAVTLGQMPATMLGFAKLYLFRKFGFFKGAARRLYKLELERILPTVKIRSLSNFSNDPKFTDIYRALGENYFN